MTRCIVCSPALKQCLIFFLVLISLFVIEEKESYSLAPVTLSSQEVDDGLIGRMEGKLRTGILAFNFEQTSEIVSLGQKESASGLIYLDSAQGKIKWEYISPEEQFFLLDGNDYTFYQPSLEQASMGTFDQIVTTSLPLAFLVGKANISSVFTVETGDTAETFALKPLEDDGVTIVRLTIDTVTKLPKGIEVIDMAGNRNHVALTPIKNKNKNPFALDIPEGVDIDRQ